MNEDYAVVVLFIKSILLHQFILIGSK